ncbi:hypothetical protein [Pseudodesulfovibrio hydrargyri]|nr:hypothetical protein [Pseudodesulfovibrio hydrargyri]
MAFKNCLSPLIGAQINILNIPKDLLKSFEPSQIGTIVGTLMDVAIPELDKLYPDDGLFAKVGLSKHDGILGDREGYPDYQHNLGFRAELKLLYVDPEGVEMKVPATRREPSARLTQKVTVKNVIPEKDILLVVAYQLRENAQHDGFYCPTIIDVGAFPVSECIAARDYRLLNSGGRWFGNYETPAILSRIGKAKIEAGEELDTTTYGRKESEGKCFNEDTNFGKLKRIPYKPLQEYLKLHGATYSARGGYPSPWKIS